MIVPRPLVQEKQIPLRCCQRENGHAVEQAECDVDRGDEHDAKKNSKTLERQRTNTLKNWKCARMWIFVLIVEKTTLVERINNHA